MKKSQNSWKRRILLFFISQSITLFGSQLVQMAVLWYITLQTDCGGWIAAFSVFSYLPQFFISFIKFYLNFICTIHLFNRSVNIFSLIILSFLLIFAT